MRLPSSRDPLRALILLLGMSLSSSCFPGPRVDDATLVFLVRHAEKADDGTDDPPLTELGAERARLLAVLLRDAPPSHIHSTQTRRTMDTAAPMAEAAGLEVLGYDGGDLEGLAEVIRSTPGTHLVVGHSNTTPALVWALGGEPGLPIDDLEYDRLYLLTLHPDGSVTTVLLRMPLQTDLMGMPLRTNGIRAQEVIRPDLSGIAEGRGWTLVNRGAVVGTEGDEIRVEFDARPGNGAAWLDDFELEDGTIEVRIRGKNVPQQSFLGVAFRGVDDETYDAIYFRPFNFLSENELSRSHSVQYISHPENTWSRLREERAGEFENSLLTPPDPDGFFRARIVIRKPLVQVFVNDDDEPSLVVTELTHRNGGRIGLWMGNASDGTFADLVIRPAGVMEPRP